MKTLTYCSLLLALTAASVSSLQAGILHNSTGPSDLAPRGLPHPAGLKVGGPLIPGGPTFGYGPAADLHTVEHGWRIYEGHPGRFIYIKVHNNSTHIWRDAKILTGVYNAQGVYLRTETSAFPKPLLPGKTVDATFGPVGPQDRAYTIIGYTAHL